VLFLSINDQPKYVTLGLHSNNNYSFMLLYWQCRALQCGVAVRIPSVRSLSWWQWTVTVGVRNGHRGCPLVTIITDTANAWLNSTSAPPIASSCRNYPPPQSTYRPTGRFHSPSHRRRPLDKMRTEKQTAVVPCSSFVCILC